MSGLYGVMREPAGCNVGARERLRDPDVMLAVGGLLSTVEWDRWNRVGKD